MGILIEFNTSQAAKSQCYSYEAVLLLQLKSGSTAASRQVERKVGLSGSKRRGEKINTCANFFVRSLLFGYFCKQSAAVVVRSQDTEEWLLLCVTKGNIETWTLSLTTPCFLFNIFTSLVPSLFSFPAGKKLYTLNPCSSFLKNEKIIRNFFLRYFRSKISIYDVHSSTVSDQI